MKTNIHRIAAATVALLMAGAATANSWKDVDYVGDGLTGHKLDIYTPDDGQPSHKVVVLIYGSAWFSNNSKGDAFKSYGQQLLDAGFAVVSINHRASIEAKFPAQIQDVKAAIRYVRGNASKYGLDTSFIGITGYSSGGHLSSLAGTTNGVKTRKFGKVKVDIEGKLGQYTGRSLIYIDQQCRVTFMIESIQLFIRNVVSPLRHDLGIGHVMDLAKLDEAMAKAATIDYQYLIIITQYIHNSSLHSARTRCCKEDHTSLIIQMGELLHQPLVLLHHSCSAHPAPTGVL